MKNRPSILTPSSYNEVIRKHCDLKEYGKDFFAESDESSVEKLKKVDKKFLVSKIKRLEFEGIIIRYSYDWTSEFEMIDIGDILKNSELVNLEVSVNTEKIDGILLKIRKFLIKSNLMEDKEVEIFWGS